MASINLDVLKGRNPHTTEDHVNPTIVPEDEFTYKDLKLDIEVGVTTSQIPANQAKNNTDLADIRDAGAIKQSIENIFNTSPGQKLLNPYLGMNLAKFLFEPITRETGELIARQILAGLSRQEPRVSVTGIRVIGDIASNSYHVGFTIIIPQLGGKRAIIGGILDKEGFNFN